jgi:hypothetical protein
MRSPDHLKRSPSTQAECVIAKFGGAQNLAAIMGYTYAAVRKWNYAAPKGSNGLVPTRALDRLMSLARLHGVLLTDDDLKPRTK